MCYSVIASVLELLAQKPFDGLERKELYNAALQLAWSLESEQDTAQRLYHGHLPLATAQTGIDLGLFKYLSAHSEKAFTLHELASYTGADPVLLARLMRYYASQSMVFQTDEGKYAASNITRNLSIPGTAAGIKHYSLTMTPAYNAIPEFLAQTKYVNPTTSAPFNLAYKTDMPVFEWRKHNPKNAKAGQEFMAAQRMGQRSVWDGQVPMHDFQLSEEDLKQERVLICDVGAGFGHQSVEFRRYNPDVKGRIVVEDLPLVQDMIPNRAELAQLDISLQPHDFMKDQPIKGAKVYYLRNVIHNWNDAPSRTILSKVAEAMAEDSVVIIDDVVMPKSGASWKQASMDLAMMTMLAAVERTEDDFDRLLAGAGLQIRELWTYDEDYGDTFIVAERLPQRSDSPVQSNTPVRRSSSPMQAADGSWSM